MTNYPNYPAVRRPSAAPLLIAGAAFALAMFTALDRLGWFQGAPSATPRPLAARGSLPELEQTTTKVFADNAPSVVHITTEKLMRWMGRITTQPEGTGTGFLWDQNGTVVTNYHVVQSVVEQRSQLKVAIGDDYYDASVIGTSKDYDIAVVRVIGAPHNLRPVQVGKSSELEVGQMVMAIGNPFGFDHSLSVGFISALNRSITTENAKLNGLIQTDAAINPGNSGGPLLDSAGLLIGMNTAIYSPSGSSAGIGFAVPSETINEIVPELLDGTRGQRDLGVTTYDSFSLPRATGFSWGLPVDAVAPNSGAAAAGVEPFQVDSEGFPVAWGDIIVAVNGQPTTTWPQLQSRLREKKRGEVVQVTVLRGRRYQRLQLQVPVQ